MHYRHQLQLLRVQVQCRHHPLPVALLALQDSSLSGMIIIQCTTVQSSAVQDSVMLAITQLPSVHDRPVTHLAITQLPSIHPGCPTPQRVLGEQDGLLENQTSLHQKKTEETLILAKTLRHSKSSEDLGYWAPPSRCALQRQQGHCLPNSLTASRAAGFQRTGMAYASCDTNTRRPNL